ncbi:MAG: glycyl-radical enzyme activating protein [Armatimonadetes bacterium]|nr:glycyl-radical enzyme activating protein [Armatimonadota bacterium]
MAQGLHTPDLNTVGRVFDIQRFAIHDGPGIRTTVFLKGCPLRCLWCHNPESGESALQLSYVPASCIACGACVAACPRGAHSMDAEGRHLFDRADCTVCGACVAECHAQALQMVGRDLTAGEALAEVMRDRPFYETSGGGMTLSGGEPLAQPEFSHALLAGAKAAGLHCAVESCGLAPWADYERLLPLVDLWMVDLKAPDSASHRDLTGAPNEPILANLRELHAAGASILVRLPTVPGVNDQPERWLMVAALSRELPGLLGFEIMPYHRLGTGKRERLGLPPEPQVFETPSRELVASWVRDLRALGVTVVNEV